jgi:Cu+-exporting ATPase
MNKLDVKIGGMHCASCASSIENDVKKIPGIKISSVNYATEKGHFEFSDPQSESIIKEKIDELGYEILDSTKEDTEERSGIFQKFIISLILSVLIFIFAMGPLKGVPSTKINWIIQFALALPVWLIIGNHFIKAVLIFIRSGKSNMNTLIGLGTSAAFLYSSFITIFPGLSNELGLLQKVYFEAVGFIISFVYLGQYFENKAKRKARESLNLLLQTGAKKASVIRNGEEVEIPVDEVHLRDFIRVRPGGKIPVDGIITKGISSIDESMISGEPIPVLKKESSEVFTGTINGESTIEFMATKVGADTFLSQIIQYVEKAQSLKPPIQRYADKISSYFVPIVIAIAIITFLAWYFFGEGPKWGFSISDMIAVLVIACPCALGLATPTAVVVSTGRAAMKGILISGGDVIEKGDKINTIIFDKTGTLTVGRPQVEKINYLREVDENIFLKEIGSIEHYSEHPISKAIVDFVKNKDITFIDPDTFEIISGKGLLAQISGKDYIVGNKALLEENSIDLPGESTDIGTEVWVSIDKVLTAQIVLNDPIKEQAPEVISALKEENIETWLISGDNEKVTKKVANTLSIDHFVANALPTDKARYVEDLQKKGRKVAMLGDGINDAPALAIADLSLAMGTGTDVAISTSDVTLIKGDISKALEFIKLSEGTMKIIRQNLFLSLIYNVLCIPLAAGLFYPFTGWMFPPALASLAMGLSSISVVTNSLRIRNLIEVSRS